MNRRNRKDDVEANEEEDYNKSSLRSASAPDDGDLVGPHLSDSDANQFVSKVLAVHVFFILGASMLCYLVVKWVQDYNFDYVNPEDDPDSARNNKEWFTRIVYAAPVLIGGLLVVMAMIPRNVIRGPGAAIVGVIWTLALAYLLVFCCVAYRSNWAHSYLDSVVPSDGKVTAKDNAMIASLKGSAREAAVKSYRMKQRREALMKPFKLTGGGTALERIAVVVDGHIMKAVGCWLVVYLSILAGVSSPEADFVTIRFLMMPVFVGALTLVYLCQDFDFAFIFNTAAGVVLMLGPALYVLRLQRWISGHAPTDFKTNEWFPASVTLLADTFRIILVDLVD